MDTHTLELLEFAKVRALLAARAGCSLGKAAAARVEPGVDRQLIHERLVLVTEMVEALRSGVGPSFGGLHDIEPLVRRTQTGGVLEAVELAEIAATLHALAAIDRWFARAGDQFPRLGGLKPANMNFSGLIAAIEACLDNRGKVLDTASLRLSARRREMGRVQGRIQETLRAMLRSPDIKRILRFPNFTMVGHHYVLPVAKDHRGEISGSVHRTSASNETVYIEPAVIGEQSAELAFLRAREAKEVRRILRGLSAQVALVSDDLLLALDSVAELDLICASARLSVDYSMAAPQFCETGTLVLKGARHPLLEELFRGERSVGSPAAAAPRTVTPIDVHLGGRFRLLVVTGPNTGGKTVALKTVGLIAAMAQSGLHVPADLGTELPFFDDVLADIGDEQSLEQSLSTFSAHVRRIAEILASATERSLVLLDELGAGTDPTDGAALGRAILDELDSIGSLAIVTTHIGDLKTYALENPRAENAAVEFDDETFQPRYRLHVGDIGQSNALKIARHLQLPPHVVSRAEVYRSERTSPSALDWEGVQTLRRDAELARQEALAARAEANRAHEVLKERLASLAQESERSLAISDARSRLQVGDRVVVARLGYDRPGRVVKLDPRKKTAVVAIGHVTWNVAIDELIPQQERAPASALRTKDQA
jgi:DNA mismatch repair protein MutS2